MSRKVTTITTAEKEDSLNKIWIQSLHINFYTCDNLT